MVKLKRFPILLNTRTVMLVNILTGYDKIEDILVYKDEGVEEVEMEDYFNRFRISAEQFIDQLEDHYTIAFLQELIKVSYKKICEEDIERGTQHHKVIDDYFKK